MDERIQQAHELRGPVIRSQTYREACTPSKEQQAQRLEVLRYKYTPDWLLKMRMMQKLGDFGRRWFPAIRWVRF